MNQPHRRMLATLLVSSLLASCDVDDCTDIGCVNSTRVIAAPESGVWEEGEYALEITHDDATAECTFTLPDDISDATTLIDCGKGILASFSANVQCTDGCDINDQFELRLSFEAKVVSLGIRLTRDDEVVLDDSRTVEYTEFYPGGPECGPACEQAQVNLTVEP